MLSWFDKGERTATGKHAAKGRSGACCWMVGNPPLPDYGRVTREGRP